MSATDNSGNTKPSFYARHFQITLNEIEKFEDLKKYLLSSKILNYIIACEEVAPSTGHKHIHIYCQFTSPKKLSIAKCCGAHIEKCRGTPQDNYNYIIKDGKIIFEEGKLRKTGALTIRDVENMTKEERKEADIRYYNIMEKIEEKQKLEINIDDWHKDDIKVIFITGKSGSGKSALAKKLIKSHTKDPINVVKHIGDFWDGVGESKVALYDDFRDSHMMASEFINFIDYNKQIMNIKGGHKLNEYKTIIITSIQHPKDIYKNMPEEAREQWLRRIKIIELTPREEILEDFEI